MQFFSNERNPLTQVLCRQQITLQRRHIRPLVTIGLCQRPQETTQAVQVID